MGGGGFILGGGGCWWMLVDGGTVYNSPFRKSPAQVGLNNLK